MPRVRAIEVGLVLVVGAASGLLVWRLQVQDARQAAPTPAVMPAATPHATPAQPGFLAVPATSQGPASAPSVVPQAPEEPPSEVLSRVQAALASGAAQDALRAARDLSVCAPLAKAYADYKAAGLRGVSATYFQQLLPAREARVFESMRDPSANADASLREFERSASRCPAPDAPIYAHRGPLYERAYKGGAEGSASAYLTWLTLDNPAINADPALLDTLRADVRKAADAGQLLALTSFAYGSEAMAVQQGFTPVEQQAYREAYFLILEQNQPGSTASQRAWHAGMEQLLPPTAPLTDSQKQAARALVQKVVAAHARPERLSTP